MKKIIYRLLIEYLPIFLVMSFVATVGCSGDKNELVNKDNGEAILEDKDSVQGGKAVYIPQELRNDDFNDPNSTWCYQRSRESENFIVFWGKGYGDKDPNSSEVPENYRVDIDDLLEKAEEFFDLNVNVLKFAEVGGGKSHLDEYKLLIFLFYQEEWNATGAGYDDVIGALWLSPNTCNPVGSTIAHEIGHSFQYQVYADLLGAGEIENNYSRGFRYGFGGNGGNTFWEQCAQWQAYQSYPDEAFESYNFGVYTENYHRHICHEWQRYASYWIHYYWADKYGVDVIGKLWKEAVRPEDPIMTYMRINQLTVDELNDELYDAATRFVTWDIDAIRSYGSNYIGKHAYKLYQLDDESYQVAYSHCPGSTGYNVIPLNVPAPGTVITTTFTGLSPGSPLVENDPGEYSDEGEVYVTTNYNNDASVDKAGWRYGYVALLENGQRIYGEMNRDPYAVVDFTVPEGCERLWFVVLGAPSAYEAHPWDEKESNDDQWPYKIKFTNTNLLGNIYVDPDGSPEDLTLTYNISFDADASAYSGTTVNLYDNEDINQVARSLVIQPFDIANYLKNAGDKPEEGKIAFAAVEPDGSLKFSTTANGYGFWFDSQGHVIGWGSQNDSKLFVEFSPSGFEFFIGQYPGKCKAGDKFTIREGFVYTKNEKQYLITFVFEVMIN
ncbi:DUF4859 domain-containing protein [Thermophagus sp. OGC60D27]|uniref:DUF4859 domain-containing protein n=1 Tax=Thermophagus sp. OGC60D27 TaxID=3458415 RepID=UPI004037D54B